MHGCVVRTRRDGQAGLVSSDGAEGRVFRRSLQAGSLPVQVPTKKTYSSVYDRILPSPHVMIKDYG